METDRVDFDEHTENYNLLLRESTSFFSKEDEYFARYKVNLTKSMVPGPVRSILEFGCGIGRNIPFLAEAYPEARIVGTDVSRASLDVARAEQPDGDFRVEGMDTQDLGTFDLIFVAGVFHHIPLGQRARIAALLRSRLAAHGTLVVFEHNPFNPVTRRIVSNCPDDADAVLVTPGRLSAILRSAGFTKPTGPYCLFVPPQLKMLLWLESRLGWLPLGGQYCLKASA